MNLSPFILVISSAFALAAVGMLYVSLSHKKALQTRARRRVLMARAEEKPLPRMLKALGVGIGQYFYKLPVQELEDSISLCETCTSEDRCREKLKIPELNPEDVEFCSNLKYLTPHSRARRIRQ